LQTAYDFFRKNDEIFAMPDTLAFFNFSTPCDPFAFALRFLPSSSPSAARAFFAGAPARALAASSSFSAWMCASSGVKLHSRMPDVSKR
jgi:hypothetical protein